MGGETRQNRSLRTKATRTLILSILLAASLGAATEMKMTVDQLRAFIESSVKKHSPDKQVADYLRQHVKLTNKLDDRTIEDLQGQGAGTRTLEALRVLRDASKDLAAPVAPPKLIVQP